MNAHANKGVSLRFNYGGSMFCLFFVDRKIVSVSEVIKQDLERFSGGCFDKDIYLVSSSCETGFISLAHPEADLEDRLGVFEEAPAEI